jgi:hypothetical protein
MSTVSYQTIKLSSGKHTSPDEGACVMELASMLAGEPFTDHPVSVCPVIGSFLRAYNDSIDNRRRQDLYRYASMVVGSRSSADVQRRRVARLAQWRSDMRQGRIARLLSVSLLPRLEKVSIEMIGPIAVRAVQSHTDETHASVLALIDDLLAIGRPVAPPSSARPERTRTLNFV